ncbi:MAG: methyltransferase domain-containing protein [Phycisphaerales bacterium]|nr:methyltransferase domain-containing protein [Phycisphaerales bacterium]
MDSPLTLAAPAFPDAAAEEVYASLGVIDKLYNYNHWIFNKVRPFIRRTVFEVGCGTGNITQFLLNKDRVVGLDPHAVSLRQASEKFRDHLNVSFVEGTIDDFPNEQVAAGSFDSVICLNVLEHIADDVGALTCMRKLCNAKGRVIVLVPALMSAYGEMDRSFGHFRRYSKRTLSRAFNDAGMDVKYSLYMNAIGYFGWLWEGRVMRRKRIRPQAAATFNRMVPFVDAFERVIRPPFGQSVIVVGTPRNDS